MARHDLELEQLDVKTTFLHGKLEEVIYMDQPLGFVTRKNKVCLLERSLCGLKQSPRQWYNCFDEYILKIGFVRSKFDSCIHVKKVVNSVMVYLLLYVDDILIAHKSKSEIQVVKAKLQKEFEMKELGNARRILGMEIERDKKNETLFLSQKSYIQKILQRYNMFDSRSMLTPIASHFKLSSTQSP